MATPVAPGAPTGPPPAAHVSLQRYPDGRHAVMDAAGSVLGLHNSLASAQRHIADYYEPQGSAPPQNTFMPPIPGGGQTGQPAPGQQLPVAAQQAALQHAQQQQSGYAGAFRNALPAMHQALANGAGLNQFHVSNGGMTATGVDPRQAADVANVQQHIAPGQANPGAASLMQAYAAFHPQQAPGAAAAIQGKMVAQHQLQQRAALQEQQRAQALKAQASRGRVSGNV